MCVTQVISELSVLFPRPRAIMDREGRNWAMTHSRSHATKSENTERWTKRHLTSIHPYITSRYFVPNNQQQRPLFHIRGRMFPVWPALVTLNDLAILSLAI